MLGWLGGLGMVRVGWEGGHGYEEYPTLRKCLKKKTKLQNDPQSLGNDLNISTPDTIAREKTLQKVLSIYRRMI